MDEFKLSLYYIRECVRERCRGEQTYHDGLLLCWLFTIKAIVCIVLNRWFEDDMNNEQMVHVAYADSGTGFDGEITVHWVAAVYVSRQWHKWHVFYISDST